MEIIRCIKDLKDPQNQIFLTKRDFNFIKIIRKDFAKIDLNVQFIELAINLEIQKDLLVSKAKMAMGLNQVLAVIIKFMTYLTYLAYYNF